MSGINRGEQDNMAGLGPIDDINASEVEFYATFQDIDLPGIFNSYKDGEIPYISIPPKYVLNGVILDTMLTRMLNEPHLLSRHAVERHPEDVNLALQTVKRELPKGNVSCRIGSDNQNGKEANRLLVTCIDPVEREIPRYLHMQMAIEIANQVKNGGIETKNIMSSLRELSEEFPGFATLVACQLVSLASITDNLTINLNNIQKELPGIYKAGSGEDGVFIKSIFDSVASGNVFKKGTTDEAIEELILRFPEEREILKVSKNFRETIKPRLYFESALNILGDEIFPKRGVRVEPLVMKKLGDLANTYTSRMVTAFVDHTPIPTLGHYAHMLKPESVKKLLPISSLNTHPQNP